MQFSGIGLRSSICMGAHRSMIFGADTGNAMVLVDNVSIWE